MKKHQSKFDPLKEMSAKPEAALDSFIRTGRVGDGNQQLTREQKDRFNRAFLRDLGEGGFPWRDHGFVGLNGRPGQ